MMVAFLLITAVSWVLLRGYDRGWYGWTRASANLVLYFRWKRWHASSHWSEVVPRPGYCDRCGGWAVLTGETPARTRGWAYICEPCADGNDVEWDEAWREYYSGRL